MKTIEEMTYEELKEEIKYTVSLMDDDAQAQHSAAYLADLTEAFAKPKRPPGRPSGIATRR